MTMRCPHGEATQHGGRAPEMSGDLTIQHAKDGGIIITHKPSDASMSGEAPAAVKKITAKVVPVAATAAGAGIGFVVAGPVGAIVGLGIGGAIDWIRHRQKKDAGPGTGAGAVSLGPDGATVSIPEGVVHLKPITINALTKSAPAVPKLRLIRAAVVAKAAANPATSPSPQTTAAKQAADALYGYFKQYPFDRMLGDVFWKSAKTGTLVKAFQKAYNLDNVTNVTMGKLQEDGFYGAQTAGALTLYTHDPVDPDPNA